MATPTDSGRGLNFVPLDMGIQNHHGARINAEGVHRKESERLVYAERSSMDTVLEQQRKLFEERERIEDALVKEMMLKKNSVSLKACETGRV